MSEQEKKRQRIYDLHKAKTKPPPKVFLWAPSSPDLKTFDYTIWGVLENKTNAIFHPNVGSFKTAIEADWNIMSDEFILKACKLFRRCVDPIIEKKKWKPYWVNLLYCVYLILWFIF